MSFPVFDKAGDVPKGFEAAYEEREGKWHAKIPDTAKIEETLTKTRSERKEFEKAAKDASEKAADLQRQLDAKSATGADTDKKVSEMLAKWEQDKNAAVKAVKDQLDAAAGELRTLKLDDKIKAAALAAGVLPTKVDAVLKLTKDSFDLADDRIVVKDAKGEVTTKTVADFFAKDYRAQMPELYQGTKATGGGASGGASKTTTTSDGSAGDRVIANPLQMLKEANEANAANAA
jgi:hypothetical protein